MDHRYKAVDHEYEHLEHADVHTDHKHTMVIHQPEHLGLHSDDQFWSTHEHPQYAERKYIEEAGFVHYDDRVHHADEQHELEKPVLHYESDHRFVDQYDGKAVHMHDHSVHPTIEPAYHHKEAHHETYHVEPIHDRHYETHEHQHIPIIRTKLVEAVYVPEHDQIVKPVFIPSHEHHSDRQYVPEHHTDRHYDPEHHDFEHASYQHEDPVKYSHHEISTPHHEYSVKEKHFETPHHEYSVKETHYETPRHEYNVE